MKKILRSIVLSLVLLFVGLISLASCSSKSEEELKQEERERMIELLEKRMDGYGDLYEDGMIDLLDTTIDCPVAGRVVILNKETGEEILEIVGRFTYRIYKDNKARLTYKVKELIDGSDIFDIDITYKCEIEYKTFDWSPVFYKTGEYEYRIEGIDYCDPDAIETTYTANLEYMETWWHK